MLGAALMTASILSEITDLLTQLIGDYGLYAVFGIMLLDAVFPAASEPVMVYAGAVAAGAFAGQDTVLFGHVFEPGLPAFKRSSRAERQGQRHAIHSLECSAFPAPKGLTKWSACQLWSFARKRDFEGGRPFDHGPHSGP